MTVTRRALAVSKNLVTGVVLLLAFGALWTWGVALLAWGTPAAFADALTWTFFMLVATALLVGIEHAQNGGA